MVKIDPKAPIFIKITDLKGPIDLLTLTDILLNAAEIILLALLIGWAVSFVRKKIKESSRVTPYEAAREKLRAIKVSITKKNISPSEFCSRISAMLRSYVKDAFQIGSLEFTTAEFLKGFNAFAAVSDESRRIMSEILSLCDLVKFSGYDPSWEEIERCAGSAEMILASLNGQKEAYRLKGKR